MMDEENDIDGSHLCGTDREKDRDRERERDGERERWEKTKGWGL